MSRAGDVIGVVETLPRARPPGRARVAGPRRTVSVTVLIDASHGDRDGGELETF
jgi:hypothetical protein